MNWYYQSLNPEMGEALAEVKKTNVERLPVPPEQNEERALISELARRIETDLASITMQSTESARLMTKRRVDATFEQLNQTVYRLYKLTQSEVQVIEAIHADIVLQSR
jgi:two-component sensor histidine kinase